MTVTLKKANLVMLIVGGIVLGASAHWLLAERYRVLVVGSGSVMRVDRWSGDTWVRNQSNWDLVSVEKRVRQQDIDKARDGMADIEKSLIAWGASSDSANQFWRGLSEWCDANPTGGRAPMGETASMIITQDQIPDFRRFVEGQLSFWRVLKSEIGSK